MSWGDDVAFQQESIRASLTTVVVEGMAETDTRLALKLRTTGDFSDKKTTRRARQEERDGVLVSFGSDITVQ